MNYLQEGARPFWHLDFVVQFSHSVMSNSLQPHGLRMLGFPVHHQLLELAQTHIHRVIDAIQPSHPLPTLYILKFIDFMNFLKCDCFVLFQPLLFQIIVFFHYF